MQVAAVQQVEAAISENDLFAPGPRLGSNCLKLVDRFELSGHIEMGSMRCAGFQLKAREIEHQSVA
jgi:hypothetical protein